MLKISQMFNYLTQIPKIPSLYRLRLTLTIRNFGYLPFWGLSILLMGSMMACTDQSASVPIQSSIMTVDTVERVQQGIDKVRQGDYYAALEDFDQVIATNPQESHAYFNRGFVYSSLGEFDQALADFTQALKLDPQMGEAYVNRGNVYLQLGDDQQAIADYEKALTINPNDAFAHNNLGLAHLNSGKPELAETDFTQAVDLEPLYAEAYFNRGLTLVDLGKPQQAIADFQKASQIWQEQGEEMASQEALEQINALKSLNKPSQTP